ncbi:MAG: signal peptidase I [Kiritimatiellia bacterium]
MKSSETTSFFGRRRIRKQAQHILRSARHVRNMREDLAAAADMQRLEEQARDLAGALSAGDCGAMEVAGDRLAETILKVNPPRPHAFWRENIEVIVVALAVAMAFRTYFIQPFKIPTSSMYPTLAGIHHVEKIRKDFTDYPPFSFLKWAVFGCYYTEVRSQSTGTAKIAQVQDGGWQVDVAGIVHRVAPGMSLRAAQGDPVIRGQPLASGLKVAGDHIFVNKVKWNFVRPARGEIMVFKTDNILHPQIKANEHYVKRMVGLPDETIGIAAPRLYINGRPVAGMGMMDTIQQCSGGYNGYIPAGILTGGVEALKLGPDQYFACGDNQRNSLDSRFWGPVPRQNLVGPAFFVYWPVSANWGMAR